MRAISSSTSSRRRRTGPRHVLVMLMGLLATLPVLAADSIRLDELFDSVIDGDAQLRIEGLQRPGIGATALHLAPAPILTPGAVLVVVGEDGPRQQPLPAVRHFHGQEAGDPSSAVFVSVHPDGRVRGWLRRGEAIEAFERLPDSATRHAILTPVDLQRDAGERSFSCGNDHLPAWSSSRTLASEAAEAEASSLVTAADAEASSVGSVVAGTEHWVNVAIDTDFEYYSLFNNTNAAAIYALDLIGFSSLIYRSEADAGLVVPYLRVFTTPADPWQQTASTACMLYEFGQHWNQQQGGVQRSVAHMLSGKNLNGGVAWVGVLCSGGGNTNIGNDCPGLPAVGPYGGGFGLSTSLTGSFNPANPQAVWDVVVVAHELGHNFNSPHTHCYGNLGGNPLPVDQCHVEQNPGCHAGPTQLPGPAGQGSGTLMSYCHLLQGGLSNIALTFGTSHPYGNAPVRVPNRMRDHVQQMAASQPACFAAPVIYANGFECSAGAPGCGGGGGAVCLSSNGATANGAWFSGDPNNRVRTLNIGAGNQLTGIAVDVRVQSMAPSWLDEARLMFSASNQAAHAVQYTPGLGMEQSGTINHSSNGVINFAGAGIQNVVAGSDGILRVEWFETFNDPQVNPDSLWSNHPAPTVCPGIRLICSNQAACDAAAQAAP